MTRAHLNWLKFQIVLQGFKLKILFFLWKHLLSTLYCKFLWFLNLADIKSFKLASFSSSLRKNIDTHDRKYIGRFIFYFFIFIYLSFFDYSKTHTRWNGVSNMFLIYTDMRKLEKTLKKGRRHEDGQKSKQISHVSWRKIRNLHRYSHSRTLFSSTSSTSVPNDEQQKHPEKHGKKQQQKKTK